MKSKYLDSCIQILKEMRGDKSNELESGQQRALTNGICKLKKLKKQPATNREEIYRIVSEVAEEISRILK